ncbi:11301_t:CDS:2 [Dentiscutata heterogama]|uniref:11301_t:CDS:1 n=1 Tax=Dentiscutata heterogama TaxID=1316150 RepID=A0ACA9LIP5_9GLOM|nr:11301_t:CDS:2 [Dentiscutata heterogama]
MSMDKYRGETSRQSPDSEDFLVQINDSLANLEEVENEGVKLINLINEHHDKIQHAGYATQDVKEKLESLYRDAIKQASREEEMDKKITKDIDKYLESIKDSRTPSDGLNIEENNHKKKRSQENTSVNNKAKKPKVSQSKSSVIIKNGTSVAAKQPRDKDIEENWILATVVGYKPESKSYEVEDADKDEASNRPGERFIVPVKNVIAIPNPGEMRSPEFPKDSTVIALYPHTTCFYKAVVVIPPSKLTPKTSRYLLTFEDDENAERYVDAHYVLDIPKER